MNYGYIADSWEDGLIIADVYFESFIENIIHEILI